MKLPLGSFMKCLSEKIKSFAISKKQTEFLLKNNWPEPLINLKSITCQRITFKNTRPQ